MESNYVLIGSLVFALIYIIILYNKIISGKNAFQRAWADVITQERQKLNTIPELQKIVEDHKEFERTILDGIVSLRSGLQKLKSDNVDPKALEDIETQTAEIKRGINLTVEAYPDLKTAGLMDNLMTEISEIQENIAAAIRIFNQNIEAFNNSIETFPGSVVNSIIAKQSRQKSFQDVAASEEVNFRPGADI